MHHKLLLTHKLVELNSPVFLRGESPSAEFLVDPKSTRWLNGLFHCL